MRLGGAGATVAILADLQRPKIRLARFADGPHELLPGVENRDVRRAGNGFNLIPKLFHVLVGAQVGTVRKTVCEGPA